LCDMKLVLECLKMTCYFLCLLGYFDP